MSGPWKSCCGIDWALAQNPLLKAGSIQAIVLLHVALHFNDHFEAWPGAETLASRAGGFHVRSIFRALNEIIALGVLARESCGDRTIYRPGPAARPVVIDPNTTANRPACKAPVPACELADSVRNIEHAESEEQYTEQYTEKNREEPRARARAPDPAAPAPPRPISSSEEACRNDGRAPASDLFGERAPPPKQRDMTPEAMVAVWNATMRGTPIPQVRELSESRKRRLRIIAKSPCHGKMSAWERVCRFVASDTFHRGERNGAGHDGWRADLDYVVRGDHALRILEGIEQRIDAYEAERTANGIHEPRPEDFQRSHPRPGEPEPRQAEPTAVPPDADPADDRWPPEMLPNGVRPRTREELLAWPTIDAMDDFLGLAPGSREEAWLCFNLTFTLLAAGELEPDEGGAWPDAEAA